MSTPTIFGYGEAMIRYAPTSSTATTDVDKGQPGYIFVQLVETN